MSQPIRPQFPAMVLLIIAGVMVELPTNAAEFDLGLRYDRGRSGHGLEIHRADDRYAVFFYTYKQDSSPEWYLCNGRVINGVMLGDCLRFTSKGENSSDAAPDHTQFASFSLDYVAPEDASACQDGVDRQDAQQLATFTWRTNNEFHEWCTEFLPVGTGYPDPYYGGIWFGGGAGGYGCSMSNMGETLSALCYYYDAEGQPRWAFGIGNTTDESLEMVDFQGFCRECEPNERERTVIGSLSLQLDSDSTPGSGNDSAQLSISYPQSPGGFFERDFTLLPLTDGSQFGEHSVPSEPVQTAEQLANWEADLLFISQQIRITHPNPFHTTSEAEFESQLESLRRRMPYLNDVEMKFEAAKLGSILGRYGRDGHSSIVPINSVVLPLQLYWFSDGVYVVDALPPYQDLIGARLTGVSQTPIEEVLHLLGLTLSRDNATTVRWFAPTVMVFADYYRGLGVIQAGNEGDPIPISVDSGTDGLMDRLIEPISVESYSEWKTLGRNTLPERPVVYLSDTTRAYWHQEIPGENTLYIQYNQVVPVDASGQTIGAFSDHLNDAFDTLEPDRVVIDLRHNNGGDNTTYGPLLDFLSQPKINRENRLFAIIGRQTFSAAMNFIADLDALTEVVFAGESSGGSPLHYGDSQDFFLPNSMMLLQISSRIHEAPLLNDQRLEIPADIPAPLSSSHYFGNVDPVLQAVFDHQP